MVGSTFSGGKATAQPAEQCYDISDNSDNSIVIMVIIAMVVLIVIIVILVMIVSIVIIYIYIYIYTYIHTYIISSKHYWPGACVAGNATCGLCNLLYVDVIMSSPTKI